MLYKLLFLAIAVFLSSCTSTPSSSASKILYTISPVEEGAFVAIDILLELESNTYKTPHNDGYGDVRFEGTNICFWASYSDRERCIDYQIDYANWAEGDSWEIKSFDGSGAVVTVKRIY